MTSLSRRTVLKSGGALALASAIPTGEAQAQGPVLRRSVGAMAINDPILVSYRNAVAAMKALPPGDPRNWTRQAQIHQNFCPHRNWFFLPWHRAYLVAFERLCRQLSGNPNFALPYWDWTANPQLPAPFATPTVGGASNPLFDNTRTSQTATIPGNVAGPARITQILGETTFEVFGSSRPTGQNNTNAIWLRRNGVTGPLEGGPHNSVHGILGGATGNMATFMSPLDPIFWLHHCNIDRLWDRWNRMGRANTANPLWRTFAFNGQFVNPAGAAGTTPFNVAVSGLLNINALGYRYVLPIPLPAPDMLVAAAPVLAKAIDLEKPKGVAKAENVPALKVNTPAEARVQVPGAQAAVLEGLQSAQSLALQSPGKPKQAPSRIIAYIRDVEQPKEGNTEVRVFINCPYLAPDTSPQDRHYAGSFTFFGGGEHAEHDNKASYLIDITDTVAKLRQAGEEVKEINVQLMPVPIPGVPNPPEVKVGSVEVAFF
jgi:tyrosinase